MIDATKALLSELIGFETVSADSNLEMIACLAGRLEDCGAKVEAMIEPTGKKANLFATLGPERDGGIVLSGHTDVVPVTDQDWHSDPFVMEERDGRLYGRGSCDMKGFIAAAVTMAPKFAAQVAERPLHFAFTYDEETGCVGAGHLVQTLKARGLTPRMALIGEPTSMRIIEGHKGCHEYTTRFHGLEGHGSAPDLGVNAVEYAVRYVSRLLALKDQLRGMAPSDSRFDPPWTTVNVGAFQGGSVHNVIAPKAEVAWEMRPVQASDADFVKQHLQAYCRDELPPQMRSVYPEAKIDTEVVGEVVGLVPEDSNEARRLLMDLTGANNADLVPFGTEAGLFQSMGMDVVVCGPGDIAQAHKANEFVAVAQLEACLGVLDGLAGKLADL
ncbi:MAG: acetylornithine deacetylase [Shimia sp.]|uniref:acetylornithine deacetylase n=1 Tax=Shimia sp. TaxID=1954381 RepID=UPI004059B74B